MKILAYIDPGVGALIWQSIIAMFVGVLFYLRRTRQWIGRQVGRLIGAEEKSAKNDIAIQVNKSKVEADHL